jgi:hypothetical protein
MMSIDYFLGLTPPGRSCDCPVVSAGLVNPVLENNRRQRRWRCQNLKGTMTRRSFFKLAALAATVKALVRPVGGGGVATGEKDGLPSARMLSKIRPGTVLTHKIIEHPDYTADVWELTEVWPPAQ